MRHSTPFSLSKLSLALSLSIAAVAAHAAPAVQATNGRDLGHSNRILVQARAGASQAALNNLFASTRGKGAKLGQSNLHVVEFPNGVAAEAVLKHFEKHPLLKFAELDKRVAVNFVPNDPYFGSEWHVTKVNAPAAWDTTQGAGVTIAILDSGVDPTHPDLVGNLVPGYNTYSNNTDTRDACGHGTAVAGVAAAATNNGAGVAGIAGAAKIMPMRIAYWDTTRNECYAYYSTIASGLTYAADHGAKVANISYGGVGGSSSIVSAAQYMQSKGGLVFVSAGNSGANTNVAYTPSMISVSATDGYDNLFSWSSYGSDVALSAPGETWTTTNGGSYDNWRGTSFASPLVAGVGALVMAANPALDYKAVQDILFSTSVDLGAAGRDIYYGYGRVNAGAAVAKAATTIVKVDTIAPAATILSPSASTTVSGAVPVDASASDNVGVTNVELVVNGTVVATDSTAPYSFSWNSAGVPNGMASLTVRAYDAAGNVGTSGPVSVNVANATATPVKDITPPVVSIDNPIAGSVSGTVSVNTSASDNSGAAGITQYIYIDGALKAKGTGASLSYSWNTRKATVGAHTIQAVAKDAAGNSTSAMVQVSNGTAATGKGKK